MTHADRAACTDQWHSLLRSSPHSFRRETTPAGHLDDGGMRWEIGRCRGCGSTLALGTPQPFIGAGQMADRWRL